MVEYIGKEGLKDVDDKKMHLKVLQAKNHTRKRDLKDIDTEMVQRKEITNGQMQPQGRVEGHQREENMAQKTSGEEARLEEKIEGTLKIQGHKNVQAQQ